MGTLNWIIMIGFFLCLVGIVLWVVKHKKDDTGDYFLSGRNETWLAVGAAIFEANIGSEHLVGLSGTGAEKWDGYGTPGYAGMDDIGSGLGICSFL
jgi:solute:Na+ symporter, SSS family